MDNDKRKARVLELGSQTKLELEHASQDYADFKTKCALVNPKLAQLYRDAGLKAPGVDPVEIMQFTHAGHSQRASEVADILEVIASVGSFIALTRSMAPAVTKYLKSTSKISESFAEKELISNSITIYEDILGASKGAANAPTTVEIDVVAGDVAGHVVAGIFAGAIIGVVDGIIWAAEEANLKADLQKAITALHPLRTAVYLSRSQTNAAVGCLQSVDALVDALDAMPVETKKAVLKGKRNKIVTMIETKLSTNSPLKGVEAQLKQADIDNNANIGDDPEYKV